MRDEFMKSVAPTRPALKYYGGKWLLAPWIISHFPPHDSYVEPFGGAGSVLLRKPRVSLETYGDLDKDVVNFFRVLRERPEELIQQIRLTAWADDEYELSMLPSADPLEAARRLFARSWLVVSGYDKHRSGMRLTKMPPGYHNSTRRAPASMDFVDIDHLYVVAERFAGVQVLNRCGFEIIKMFMGQPGTLIYADPPYMPATRQRKSRYVHEMKVGDHARLANLLNRHDGPVVVSGYACYQYERWYEARGWQRVERKARTSNGLSSAVECLWLNEAAVAGSHSGRQMKLLYT